MSIPESSPSPDPVPVPVPPDLPEMDTESFRRKLAGLADPDRTTGMTEKTEIRETASRFCSILAYLFGRDLDRLTLSSRIDSALESACAKVSDDDLDRFVTICLDHIQADAAQAAACEPLRQLLETFLVRPPEWRQEFLHYIGTHRLAVVVRGKARWDLVKNKEIEL